MRARFRRCASDGGSAFAAPIPDHLLEASVIGGEQAAGPSIWEGEIPAPVVPAG
jgi:hypothetical protein